MEHQQFEQMARNGIRLEIGGAAAHKPGGTRFGGNPDVPPDFAWPVFETSTFDDDTVKPRPLGFLAQFNCAELTGLDRDGLLPQTGLLSFFYELDSQRWGFDPKDAGCARVYWFEDTSALSPAVFPDDLETDYRLPMAGISATAERSLPGWEDVSLIERMSYDKWEELARAAGWEDPENCSRLLGWPNVIQNNMTWECELVSQGHYLGGSWEAVPVADKLEAARTSLDGWRLLFQLDTVEVEDFELMFGDCGRIYFYIRKEDLARRRFDQVWLIQQCC